VKTYLAIINAYWQRALTYRATVIGYRFGEIGEVLVLILMWSAIYSGREVVQGYALQEMITYVLIGSFFHVIVRNWLATVVAFDIKEGRLSMFLLRPLSYFEFVLAREVGRISLATLLSVGSQALVMVFFAKIIIVNFDAARLALIGVMLVLAFLNELLISFIVGCIAFWTDEVDGLHSTIERIKRFFSGGYFPLSLLPPAFFGASLYGPFAYSFFVPAQLYLGKMDAGEGLKGIVVQLAWIGMLGGAAAVTWKLGLKKYEGVGI